MGKYNTIRSEMWTDKEYQQLSQSQKLFYNYILSCPLGNLAGYYKLPVQQIKNDLCRYNKETDEYDAGDLEGFRKEILLKLKTETKLWKYDLENEQIFIPTYLKYNKVGGEKQLLSIKKSISTLAFCRLHIDFLFAVVKYANPGDYKYLGSPLVAEILSAAEDYISEESDFLLKEIYIP